MKKKSFSVFIGRGFCLILRILSYLIPKNKNQILLGSNRRTTFVGNSKYLFLYLCKIKSPLDFSWITANRELYLELKNKNLPVLYYMSTRGFLAILRSQFLVCTHGSADFFPLGLHGKFKIIMLSHGTSIIKGLHTSKFQKLVTIESNRSDLLNKSNDDNEYLRYHTVIASSNEDKQNIIASREAKNVMVLGYTRNDIFYENNLVYENYQDSLNLHKFAKVILYCPTFRDYPSSKKPFSENFLIKLNEFLKKEDSIFLIKGHIDEKSLINIKNLSNIRDISEEVKDIQDLLPHVDLLISDYSSIFFDFVLRDKPIIFYPYDFEEYTENSRDLFCDYFNDLIGPFAKNEDDLLKLINSSQKDFANEEYRKKFELFKKRYNKYVDGKSCERVYNYILKLIT